LVGTSVEAEVFFFPSLGGVTTVVVPSELALAFGAGEVVGSVFADAVGVVGGVVAEAVGFGGGEAVDGTADGATGAGRATISRRSSHITVRVASFVSMMTNFPGSWRVIRPEYFVPFLRTT
jgi:hypothetical protein